ncbi:MAG: hypothetical protein KDA21_09250 [Phycisphaerales bacterium]|nr:hypothetical protein [Phycisphaerales bacterium]
MSENEDTRVLEKRIRLLDDTIRVWPVATVLVVVVLVWNTRGLGRGWGEALFIGGLVLALQGGLGLGLLHMRRQTKRMLACGDRAARAGFATSIRAEQVIGVMIVVGVLVVVLAVRLL